MKKALARGFTLIELLVVLAITAVLLGIIVTPMIQGFNFTRAAEGLADEQERGRILVEQLARERRVRQPREQPYRSHPPGSERPGNLSGRARSNGSSLFHRPSPATSIG